MRSDGTILGRHFCKLPKETDHLAHSINRIKKTQQHGNYKTPRLWAKAKGINHDSMAAGMASSAGTSKAFDYGDVALGWAKNKVKSGSTSINPNEIRYSQSSVNGSNDIIQSMKANGWQGDPIDVVEMPDGIYTTIDNTRVVSAREAGINVEANVHGYNDPLPNEYIERFTTKKGVPKTWGEAIELRVGKQKASFRNGNPYGKLEMETIK